MKTKHYICRFCKKPGSVDYEETGDPKMDAFLEAFAEMLAHDSCVPQKPQRAKQTQLPIHETRSPHND